MDIPKDFANSFVLGTEDTAEEAAVAVLNMPNPSHYSETKKEFVLVLEA